MADWMRAAGFGGVVIMFVWSMVSSIPPVPLRETGMRLTGFVWGVPRAFVICFLGSMLGSVICFLAGRYLFHARVTRWISGDKHLTAIRNSLSHGGLKLILLLRIGPFPFSWMSLFLSATDISMKTYLLATIVGLQWVWYQVWIGTVLDNVEAAANLDFSATSTKVNIAVAFASTILSLIAMWYIKKMVDEILERDAVRAIAAANSDVLPFSDVDMDSSVTPITPDLDLPAGFARRFTPPSHALWTAHMQNRVEPNPEEKKEEHKSSTEEVVSAQDATAGFVSGPLVDIEIIAKAVVSARKASQEVDPRKKAMTETGQSLEERDRRDAERDS